MSLSTRVPSLTASTVSSFTCRALSQTLQQGRQFSTSTVCNGSADRQLKSQHHHVPDYPHGPNLIWKKANFGLYGGQMIRFGNKISERNEIKTRRKWKLNVHNKRLWSVALGRFVQTKVTARVLRTIDKCGGLDEYVLGNSKGRVKELGMAGWKLRWRIMQKGAVKQRLREERKALGIASMEEELNAILNGSEYQMLEDGGMDAKILEEIKAYDEALDTEAVELGSPEEEQSTVKV